MNKRTLAKSQGKTLKFEFKDPGVVAPSNSNITQIANYMKNKLDD